MDEERLTVEFKVTNSKGEVTAGLTLGQMKLEDVKVLEKELLKVLVSQLDA